MRPIYFLFFVVFFSSTSVFAQFCNYDFTELIEPTDLLLNAAGDRYGTDVGILEDLVLVSIPESTYAFDNKGLIQSIDYSINPPKIEYLFPEELDFNDGFGNQFDVFENTFVSLAHGTRSLYYYVYENAQWEYEVIEASDPSDIITDGGPAIFENRIISYNSQDKQIHIFDKENGAWTESYLQIEPENITPSFFLGSALAFSKDKIIIGDPSAEFNGVACGAVFVFDWDGTNWIQSELVATQQIESMKFGSSIASSEDYLVIGAPGDGTDGLEQGAVYIYSKATNWVEEKLLPFEESAGSQFGNSLSIDANRIAVGAKFKRKGNQLKGAVFILSNDNGAWSQELLFSDADPMNEELGAAVYLKGNRLLAGAPRNDLYSTSSGAISIFDYDQSNWSESERSYVEPYSKSVHFGNSIALEDDLAVITTTVSGAVYPGNLTVCEKTGNDWLSETIPHPMPNDFRYFATDAMVSNGRFITTGSDWGEQKSIFIYEKINGNWEYKILRPDNIDDLPRFADFIAFDGQRILATVNTNNFGVNMPQVLVFEEQGDNWVLSATLEAPIGVTDASYGASLAIDGDRIVVGQRSDKSNFTNGGSVYVYDFNGTDWIETKILPEGGTGGEGFGINLDIDGDRIVVMTQHRPIYVFNLMGGVWEETKINRNDIVPGSFYEFNISLVGDQFLLGDPSLDEFGEESGAAILMDFNGSTWEPRTFASNELTSNSNFGINIGFDGKTIMVSEQGPDNNRFSPGKVRVFELDESVTLICEDLELVLNDNNDVIQIDENILIANGSNLCGNLAFQLSQTELSFDDLGIINIELQVSNIDDNQTETCISEVSLTVDNDNDGFNYDEDCDDTNAGINPQATEIPNNGIDEDCNGVDEIIDMDNDGYNSNEDCDDNDASINPGATEIPNNTIDENCDGIALVIDSDNDGYNSDEDCDDINANINPGATEIPNNGVDEDCDGEALIIDQDNDGYNSDEDCDDLNSDVNPGAIEIANNDIDEDCDGDVLVIDEDNDGYNSDEDCDDANADIFPGAIEIANNGIDENCDGFDEIVDLDNDGYNSNEDCDDTNAAINPDAMEICDNIDNNCDGDIDEGFSLISFFLDADQDGFGDANVTIEACESPLGYINNSLDCDDQNPNVNPDVLEISYNGIDDDCDPTSLDDDLDQDGFLLGDDCNDMDPLINPDALEIPNNGIDEDCDGIDLSTAIDEQDELIINLMPNPTQDQISIVSEQKISWNFQIYNQNAKLVKRGVTDKNINLASLHAGVYIVFLYDDNGQLQWTTRVVKL